ncbi:MAG: methyltransferase [Myxococcales bacterium]|nr:methyltransferase [Myxococcales bacterium]
MGPDVAGRAARAADLAHLGARLRAALTPRAVTTCLGVSAITGVPLARAAMPTPCPPAAAPIWLWCAGCPAPAAALARALGDTAVATAIAADLAARDGDQLRPRVRLAPVGAGLVVCDLADRADDDAVPWPDDSTLHLASCLPRILPGPWLDVGAGPAALALAAGPSRARVRATDVNVAALALATRGLALAGRDDVEVAEAELVTGADAGWRLITMNAPIPVAAGLAAAGSRWHHSVDDLVPRLWRTAAALLDGDGELLVHGVDDDDDAWAPPPAAGGTVTIARYGPVARRGFAVTRWRPHGPALRRRGRVALGPGRPYVLRADLDAIEGGGDPHADRDLR